MLKEHVMKKLVKSLSIALILSLLVVSSAFAMGGGNVKGEVVAIDAAGGTLTLETNKGETVIVHAPEGFDFALVEVGDSVLVKGEAQEDGSVLADSVKTLGGGQGRGNQGRGNDDQPEGGKDNSAYCSEDKKETSHPLAVTIAERYGADEATIAGWFCEGYSFGAIMLAFKTSEATGGAVEDLLAARSEGQGWGQIWKDLGLIGSEREGHSPPGLLNRPDHAGPPDEE
jgi:hypothetical protein